MLFDSETRLWLAFAGWAFALMGVSLAAGAEGHAASAAEWPGARADASRLTFAYRAAGAGFVALGLGLAALAWVTPPAALAGLTRPIHLSAAERVGAGLLLICVGAGLAVHRLTQAAPRLPAALAADGLLERPSLRRRAASAAAWLLSAEFLLYGCFLLSRRGGHP